MVFLVEKSWLSQRRFGWTLGLPPILSMPLFSFFFCEHEFIHMKIMLDMVGWRKVEDIPKYTAMTGNIEISFHPPVRKFIEPLAGKALTEDHGVPFARFEFTGKYFDEMPVFSIAL